MPKQLPEILVSKKQLYKYVNFLCALNPPRNVAHMNSLNKAADYILVNFHEIGYTTTRQKYLVEKETYQNIIATYQADKEERIIIGAHYDVCGDQPGADDNASAVAGLLEIARLVLELKPEIDYRVDFVAYSLEEPPYFATPYMGSAVHAQSLKEEGVKVKGMICLEMIGYFTDEPNSQEYPVSAMKAVYPKIGNFIGLVGKLGQGSLLKHMKKFMKKASDLPISSIQAPGFAIAGTGIDFSDHRNYWALGYPAVMITDTSLFRNPHYHQTSDTIDTLDFDRMAEVVKGVYWAVANFK